MFNVIIFGPPGSGKGTQSEKIIEKYKLKHLSTGDLLRKEKKSGSELGVEIAKLINRGELVPDDMVQNMVEAFIMANRHEKGFIFDGFPRTVSQAEWIRTMLKKIDAKINIMLSLVVEEDELKKRILERGKKSNRADDQNEEIIKNRIRIYHQKTKPVKDFFEKLGKYKPVEGTGSLNEVFERICSVIDGAK